MTRWRREWLRLENKKAGQSPSLCYDDLSAPQFKIDKQLSSNNLHRPFQQFFNVTFSHFPIGKTNLQFGISIFN
ncbi:MAG: hypothetical protein IKI25_05085 [Bacteroidales bacterium]|nr:hypothetical protein [Bacteroidales bacterium]